MSAQLHLKSVNKKYNPGSAHEVHAVQDPDLAVGRGEIVALLGSSGCGKTATLRMIAGFEEVTSGEVDIDGVEPMTSVTPMRLKRRAPAVNDGDQQEKVLKNAPAAREGFFAVPKVVE